MDLHRKWKIVRVILTTFYLMAGWVLFTAAFDPLMLGLGLILSFLVSLLTFKLFIEKNEVDFHSLLPRIHYGVFYISLVIYKMYIASFKMLWLIIRGRINPRVVHFRTRLKSDIARVALTSSITLTPGTITLSLDDDHLIVHWLDAKTTHSRYAGELVKGVFERLLKRIWI